MALFTSMSAFAAVNPYDALEVTPNEGEVTSLQHFVITFADLPVVVNQNAIPTLEKAAVQPMKVLCAPAMTASR